MNKIYVTTLAVVMTALSLLSACERSESMELDELSRAGTLSTALNGKDGLTVSNGWLKFSNMDNFNAIMKMLHNNYERTEKLKEWERNYNAQGFISLRNWYEQLDADTAEDRTAPTADSLIHANKLLDCPDSRFATVLSKDGYIQIADTVYSFKPGNEKGDAYAIPSRAVKEIIAHVAPQQIKGTKVHPSSFMRIPFVRWREIGEEYTGPVKLPICFTSGGPMGSFWGQVGADIYGGDNGDTFPEHNGRTVKMNYHRWRVGYIFYASAGVRMKMWKHTRFAGWQSVTYADQMTMEACLKGFAVTAGSAPYPFTSYTSPSWPGFTRYAENNFEKTLKWVGSFILSEIALEHFNFHWKLNYRGRIAERDIRQ